MTATVVKAVLTPTGVCPEEESVNPTVLSEWAEALKGLFDTLGVPVALTIAIGGWLHESWHRRKSERERAAAIRREVYFEVASTLFDYLIVGERRAEIEFFRVLPKLALVSPEPIRRAAVEVTSARSEKCQKTRRDAMDRLIHAMECDLEGEKLPGCHRVPFGPEQG